MAGRLPPEIKNRLQAEGRWRDFTRRRNTLNMDDSLTPEQRLEILLKEFEPIPEWKKQGYGAPNTEDKYAGRPRPSGHIALSPMTAPGTPVRVLTEEEVEAMQPVVRFTCEAGQKPDEREEIRWIYDHIDTKVEKITEAPSPGALAWLRRLQGRYAQDFQSEFYKLFSQKCISNKSADETGERMSDDGSDVLDLIERVAKASGDGQK